MHEKEAFSTVRVPRALRLQLKRMAAAREQPMYEVLEDLIDQAAREHTDEYHSHEPCVETLTTQGQ